MTNKKSTKRALLLSALSLLLCVSMLVGSTFAWFTDSVTSGKNQIVAGNLDVELDYKKVVDGKATEWDTVKDKTDIFNPDALWEPGHVEVVYLRVTNKGSLQLKYQLGVNFKDITIGKTEDGKDIKLSDHLVFATVASDSEKIYANRDEVVKAAAGTEKGLKDYNGKTTALEVGGVDYLTLIVYMPETVGNEANYRGDAIPTIELGINLFATQYTAEEDSFDKFYDKDAWVDGMKVYNAADLISALSNEDKVILVNDIETPEVIKLEKNVAINLNGKTLSASLDVSDDVDISIENGTIANADKNVSGIQINKGNVTLTDVEITSARHGVRVEGGEVVINDGIYKVSGSGLTQHALNVSDGGKVTVNGGTFIGPKGTTADSGSAVNVQAGSTVIINGGDFSKGLNSTLANAGTLTIYGGTFDQNPAAYVAPGYKAVANGDGSYTVLPDVGTDLSAVAGYPGVYSGTQAKTYYISGADGLVNASKLVDTLSTGEGNSANFILLSNVDMTGKTWKPIDKMWVNFDGNGYTISNLTAEAWKAGFFGYLGGGEIKNLTLENVNVTGAQVGAFAGSIEGKITNCYLKGDNTITWAPKYQFDDPNGSLEAWNGIGAITGVTGSNTVNAEIVDGATVTLNKAGFVTDPGCTFIDNLTGYINPNNGTVVNNGQIIIGVDSAAELQKMANAGKDVTIKLLADIADNVEIKQNTGAKVVIDGDGHTFEGILYIDGGSSSAKTESLLIKNINFVTDKASAVMINNNYETAKRYAHNVTVEKCSFTATGAAKYTAKGFEFNAPANIQIKDCTGTGLHSLLWSKGDTGTDAFVVDGVKMTDCKNGLSFGTNFKVVVKNCEIETVGNDSYGIRGDANGSTTSKVYNMTVEGCKITAKVPVQIRKAAAGTYYTLNIGTGNEFVQTGSGYQIIVTETEYADDVPELKPCAGNCTVNGADGLVVYR